jgi:hypothetical protein
MPKGVIDLLESVEVDAQNGKLPVFSEGCA